MKQHYDLLLVGATAYAAGLADRFPNQTIAVIENGCTAAPEFSAALKTDGKASGAPDSPFKADALRRKALTEDGEWLPALSPILAERLKLRGADVYFFSSICALDGSEGGYTVTFSCYGVKNSFTATRVIDTTSRFVTRAFFTKPAPSLKASLNYFTDDLVLHTFPCEDDIAAAREALLARHEGRILNIASELALTPETDGLTLGAKAAWLPSARFGNAFEAYAAAQEYSFAEGEALPAKTPAPVDDGEFDVITVGLGTAGAVNAVAARREGLRVLGLESLSVMGGTATAGGVFGYYFGFKGGLYQSIDDAAKGLTAEHFAPSGGVGGNQKIITFDRLFRDEDIVCRYGAFVVDVIKVGNRVVGAVWTENGVLHTARAKFVIDCTAEASVCVAADCEMIGGRKSDDRLAIYSSVFFCSHMKDGRRILSGGNQDNGGVWHYDADDFGRAVLCAATTELHLKHDYSSHEYLGVAPLIGLREGQKIVGEETVDFETMIDGGFCEKPVYYGWSNLDNHGKDMALEDRIYQDFITICGLWGYGVSIPVPMGALIPKGVDGLLAAGRNVSIDHNTAFGLRMKDDVSKSGEAAAILAALAVRDGVPAKKVSVDELRARLFESGCLKGSDRVMLEKQKSDELHELPLWCFDDAEIAAGLASDAPGYFMWSARTLRKTELCRSLLASENVNARYNAALALSLLGDDSDEVVDTLIECAKTTDGYRPKTARKYITFRSVSAICALGRLGAARAVPTLLGMLRDDSFIEDIPFEPYDFIDDRRDVYFQYRSHCITALIEAAKKAPSLKYELKSFLTAYVNEHKLDVSLQHNKAYSLDCTPTFKKLVEAL